MCWIIPLLIYYDLFPHRIAGVDLMSQEAYEMASRGAVRPDWDSNSSQAVVYSMKLVDWAPPKLTIGNRFDIDIHLVST